MPTPCSIAAARKPIDVRHTVELDGGDRIAHEREAFADARFVWTPAGIGIRSTRWICG
jgi:hypothetical protein